MQTFDITLTGMAYGGDAFGRDANGRMIFVPFAIPGERIQAEIVETHKRWARARLVKVLKASPERVAPRCRHFTDCGGCHYQHMPYQIQLKSKAEIVRSQLERLGGFEDPPVETIIASQSPWNTRNHLKFSLTPDGRLGFNAPGSNRVVPIDECHLPEPNLASLWPRLDLETIQGLKRITLRTGIEGERMLILHGDDDPDVNVTTDLPASVVWLSPRGMTVLAGEGFLTIDVLDRAFKVSANSFFQAHTALAGEVVQHVLEALRFQPGETILDLYAGVGLFSAFLAQKGVRVVAVEESPVACADFENNLAEFDHVELYEAPVEVALPAIHTHPSAVIVDPPRVGLSLDAIKQLINLSSPLLVYVSCDPATLARDGQRLVKAGYQLERCTPIDMFPQTYHIETLSIWRR
jgi:23S rRNA (uracil1939-C5)-methyltransferase